MSSTTQQNWLDLNQRALAAALGKVSAAVEAWLKPAAPVAPTRKPVQGKREKTPPASEESALASLCGTFRLSPFERDVLLLCAGPDLDARFATLIGMANSDPRRVAPTFGLALAALPDAHWSALAPSGALRRWRLIEVGSGESLTTSSLRIDERVLHFLTGIANPDERLQGSLHPVTAPSLVPESQRALAERIATLWTQRRDGKPLIQLCGESAAEHHAVASVAAAALGLSVQSLRAADISHSIAEREAFARLLEREAVLGRFALLVDVHDAEGGDVARAISFLNSLQCFAFVSGRERLVGLAVETSRFDFERPAIQEQHDLWREALGPMSARLNGLLEGVVRQFQFGAGDIRDVATQLQSGSGEPKAAEPGARLWNLCRRQARAKLGPLAQRIEATAAWDDLVLPEAQKRTLQEIAAHVRQRFHVYENWGFAAKSARGLSISALFSGASGTGKTMAAEVLANELHLDLFRIDLSAVVSKYIGDTEKNLRRVFDAAEAGGAILLFDEADALFGKRSEVKDSHDRYANIEVGYLLQRMEAYRGLAILTTNVKNALDPAFLRRLRFVVQFPFPDVPERAEIWQRVFPKATPTEALDFAKLAQLNVAGGNIRNIALNAAFLAADEGVPVRMKHLLHATHSECGKLERPPAEMEIGGWA